MIYVAPDRNIKSMSAGETSSLRPLSTALDEGRPIGTSLTDKKTEEDRMPTIGFGKTGLRFNIFGIGTIWFGRKWPMDNEGYENPDRAEIENYLLKHPKIGNVAVVGVPDPRLGEVGAAFIILKKGQQASEEEILEFCKDRMSNLRTPRYVFFTEELPLTPQGKVKKFILREKVIKDLNLGE